MSRSAETVLSELVVDTDFRQLPDEAIAAATTQAFDCVGVTLAASAQPAGAIIAEVTAQLGGTPHAGLIGSGLRTSVAQAAWANGSMAHLLDFDDTGSSHPTACLLPVALAVGELTGATGREAIGALVLGYEVFERLAAAARPYEPLLRTKGYHPTSLWGSPAAAAVAGRLLGLDSAQLQIALSIAASDASGLSQQFGTWAKGLNAGNAARAGVMAALLAKQGYWADSDGITGRYGLYTAAVGEDLVDLSTVTDALGHQWHIVSPGLSIKPYPACTSTLRAVDAMLLVHADPAYAPDQVERIVVQVHPDLLHTLRYLGPTEGFRGKFSLDYTVAAAALDGAITLDTFSDSMANRPEFRAMLARVELERHPEWDIARRHDNPLEVTLSDGTVLNESVPAHRGSSGCRLPADEVRAKFLACAQFALSADHAEHVADTMASVAKLESIGEVLSSITPP